MGNTDITFGPGDGSEMLTKVLTPRISSVYPARPAHADRQVRRGVSPQGGMMPEIEISRAGGAVPAYLAVPDGDGPWPGVVIVHDALGMTTDLHRQADWLAGAGFLTLAPDLLHCGWRPRCVVAAMRALTSGLWPRLRRDRLRANIVGGAIALHRPDRSDRNLSRQRVRSGPGSGWRLSSAVGQLGCRPRRRRQATRRSLSGGGRLRRTGPVGRRRRIESFFHEHLDDTERRS